MLLPIAYQYAKQHNVKVDICVNTYNETILPLLQAQSWINEAYAIREEYCIYVDHAWRPESRPNDPEVIEYFENTYDKVYYLGYREPPFNQLNITLANVYDVPIDTTNLVSESCIDDKLLPTKNLAVIAEGSREKCNDVIIETLYSVIDNVKDKFEKIIIPTIRSTEAVKDYYERIPYTHIENEDCDFLKLSNLMWDSLVVTSYSSSGCLAYAMKVPYICILGYEWHILDHFKPGNNHYKHNYMLDSEDSEGLQKAIEEIMNDQSITS